MSDWIERDKAYEVIANYFDQIGYSRRYAKALINKVPSADVPTTATGVIDAIHEAEYRGYMKAVEDRPQGEWIKKPHKVYLLRDYEPDIIDYRDRQYNEEDHSIIQYWWHCNQCDYEASRWAKPTANFCPNCGARMKGADDD